MNEETAPAPPFVSVVIPVYNDPVRVRETVKALARQDYPGDRFEIIVVDNGSADQLRPQLTDYPVTIIEESAVRSSYAARNRGVLAARGEIIAFTDSDCIPENAWLSSGVRAFQEKNAALVGGQMRYRFSSKRTGAEYLDALANSENKRSIEERGVTMTANLFVRKDIFEEIGPFPATVISGGDIYFTGKATAAGYRLAYAPGAVVGHPTRTFTPLMKRFFRIGTGKASLKRLPLNDAGARLIGKPGRRNRLAQLNPLDLHRRLSKCGYRVSFGKFLKILITLYAALTATALGAIMERRGTSMTDSALPG
ncbi:MAG: glycosyltransferase [Deltaproteobacteria bacterium]|nr:glycosyltransferase [Deltaproteobacteria bacterium]